jgi:hypothetical protein
MRKVNWYFRFCPYTLAETGADRLELKPTRVLLAISFGLIVLGLLTLGGMGRVLTFDPLEDRGARWFYGGGLVALGLALGSLKRVVLDKRHNVLTVARGLFRVTRLPLSSVCAVEVTHVRKSSSMSRRMSHPAAERLDLLLSGLEGPDRIHLTLHSQPSTTRRMALRIADFLQVQIEGQLPEEEVNTSPSSWAQRVRSLAAQVCFWGALAALLGFLGLSLQQTQRDELDKTIRAVQARLIDRNVTEWIEGGGNWYVRGVFELTVDGQTVESEGNLIPKSFYREHFGFSRRQVVPRDVAAPFADAWVVGMTYDAFIHRDQPTYLFFEPPPSGAITQRQRWQLLTTSALLFALCLILAPKTTRAVGTPGMK